MKTANAEHQAAVIQKLGKEEEDLTWEEDLQVFFESTGATSIQSRLSTGFWVSEASKFEPGPSRYEQEATALCGYVASTL